MSSSRRKYPDDVKWAAVHLVRAGHTPSEVSRRFGPSSRAIREWVTLRASGLGSIGKLSELERAELILLRFKEQSLEDQLRNACELLTLARTSLGITGS